MYVKATSAIRNHCEKALISISCKWGVAVEDYIRCQGLVKWSLKFIAIVTNWHNIPNLKTNLVLANTQAVKWTMKRKTFYSRRLFLITQDWQTCKKNPVSSRDLLDKELHNVGINLNLVEKIYAGRLLLPVPEPTTPALTKITLAPPTLAFSIPTFFMLALCMPAPCTHAPFIPVPTMFIPTPTMLALILVISAPTTMPTPTATMPAPTPTSPAVTPTTPTSSSKNSATLSAFQTKVVSVMDLKKTAW